MGFLAFSQPPPCPVTWGPTVQISNTPSSAFSPKLAVVGDTVHVIYDAGPLYYRRSTTAGQSWDTQLEIVPTDSMPGQIFNRPFAARGSHVYFVWENRNASSVKIRRSTDAGSTWLEPQILVINQPFNRYSRPMVATVDSFVYVVVLKNTNSVWQWFLTRSSDYGATWDSIRQITFGQYNLGDNGDLQTRGTSLHFVVGGSVPPSGREIVYMVSTDRGLTWSGQQVLSTIDNYQAWGSQLALGDFSEVYICWLDAKYGSIGGFAGTVLLRRSTDNGQTWQPEVRVTPVPAANGSSVAVSGSTVHVGFGDERDGFRDATARYKLSTDQSLTWCDEITLGGPLRRALSPSVGSTLNRVYAVWSSDRSTPGDTAHVFFRRGDVITRVGEENTRVPEVFTFSAPYPNPFNPTTTVEFTVPHAGTVIITVYDVLGQQLFQMLQEVQSPGNHRFNLDGSLWPSGIYYVRMQYANTQIIRKAVLLR